MRFLLSKGKLIIVLLVCLLFLPNGAQKQLASDITFPLLNKTTLCNRNFPRHPSADNSPSTLALTLNKEGFSPHLQQLLNGNEVSLSRYSNFLPHNNGNDLSQNYQDEALLSLLNGNEVSLLNGGSLGQEGASALPLFVRIVTTNVYFYSSPTLDAKLFALIPTYYLRVTGQTGNFYEVELLDETLYHGKLIGYVEMSQVKAVDYSPVLPLYPAVTVYALSGGSKIFSSPTFSSLGLVTANNGQMMGYYGKALTENTEWYYICYKGKLGYVDSSCVSIPPISEHPTALQSDNVEIIDERQQTEDTPSDKLPTQQADATQTALILLISLPVVVIVVVAFFPSKTMKKRRYTAHPPVAIANEKSNTPRYFDDYL